MSILDIILLIILIYAAFDGFRKGLIAQAAKLAALIVGIWGAIRFSDFTANLIAKYFTVNAQYLSLIAFAVTFIALVVGVHFLGIVLEKVLKLAFLGIVNKLLGMVLGFLKMALIASVILIIVDNLNVRFKFLPEEYGEKSFLYEPVKNIAPTIYPYLKFDEIRATFEETFKQEKPE